MKLILYIVYRLTDIFEHRWFQNYLPADFKTKSVILWLEIMSLASILFYYGRFGGESKITFDMTRTELYALSFCFVSIIGLFNYVVLYNKKSEKIFGYFSTMTKPMRIKYDIMAIILFLILVANFVLSYLFLAKII